jgi:hypothetical protein
MTDRPRRLSRRNGRVAARGRRPVAAGGGVLQPGTIPTQTPLVPPPDEPTLLGFPVDAPEDEEVPEEPAEPTPGEPDTDALYVLRTADPPAGALLMIGGAAGVLSLFLPWVEHGQQLGLTLVRSGLETADLDALVRSGLLLPVGVVVAGGVFFLLGLLAFRPARGHRVVGVTALLIALAVAAGIVVRVADVGWDPLRTDPGVLCAVVLVGAGVLGALKAMLTPPEVTTDPR